MSSPTLIVYLMFSSGDQFPVKEFHSFLIFSEEFTYMRKIFVYLIIWMTKGIKGGELEVRNSIQVHYENRLIFTVVGSINGKINSSHEWLRTSYLPMGIFPSEDEDTHRNQVRNSISIRVKMCEGSHRAIPNISAKTGFTLMIKPSSSRMIFFYWFTNWNERCSVGQSTPINESTFQVHGRWPVREFYFKLIFC